MSLPTLNELLTGKAAGGAPEKKRTQVTVVLDPSEKKEIQTACDKLNLSMAQFVRACIGDGLEKVKTTAAPPAAK